MGPVHLLVFLLCAGALKTASSHLRIFDNTTEEINRRRAVQVCKEKNMTLATLYDKDDATFASSYESDSGSWIGLTGKKHPDNTRNPPTCPSMTGGRNESRNCSETLYFMCARGPPTDNVRLNWCSARQYCQYHLLGDLAGDGDIKNRHDTDTFWIAGNMSDDWEWDDGGCSTYREWGTKPDSKYKFATAWENKLQLQGGDESTTLGVCSKGDQRIVVVNRLKTWEGALEYCDKHHSGLLQIVTEEDQRAVEQWLGVMVANRGAFWVGLRQSRVFGFWIWKDRMVGKGNWEGGTHPEMPMSHECGVIDSSTYKWRDHNCLVPLPFICEERIVWLK